MANRTSWVPSAWLDDLPLEQIQTIANDPTDTGGGSPILVDLTINQAGGYGGILTRTEE